MTKDKVVDSRSFLYPLFNLIEVLGNSNLRTNNI